VAVSSDNITNQKITKPTINSCQEVVSGVCSGGFPEGQQEVIILWKWVLCDRNKKIKYQNEMAPLWWWGKASGRCCSI